MINKAKSLLASKKNNLSREQIAEAAAMINLIQPNDTIYSWMAKCAEAELDCMLWEDLFEPLMPDSSELTEEEGHDLRQCRKDIEGYFSYVSI